MSKELTILLKNINTPGTTVSEKQRAAGYHNQYDSLHTVELDFSGWRGYVSLQGTLELFPGENDWVELKHDDSNPIVIGNYQTEYNDIQTLNFRGNFVWIRAIADTISGEIVEIRYNY